jgi:hypothetical protein
MALTLGNIYSYLNTMLKKHSSGNSFTPDQFNSILAIENIKFFNHQIEQIQQYLTSDKDFREELLSSKLLRPLLTTQNVTPTTGVYNLTGLTNTFVYWVSAITTAIYNGRIRRINIITHNEFEKMQTNLLSPPIKHNLVAILAGNNITIYPTDVGEIALTYVKLPTTPIYDYYIDSNRNKIFLEANSTVILEGIEVGSEGQTEVTGIDVSAVNQASDYFDITGDITDDLENASTFDISGSTGNDGTYTISSYSLSGSNTRIYVDEEIPNSTADGTIENVVIASQTVEFDYGQEFYPMITEYLLSRLAVRTKDQLLFQSSENEQIKDKTQ